MLTRCYPARVANPNVPKEVFLVAETATAEYSGFRYVYFITRDGSISKVGNWTTDPRPATMHDLVKVTGDTPKMIEARWKQHFGGVDERSL